MEKHTARHLLARTILPIIAVIALVYLAKMPKKGNLVPPVSADNTPVYSDTLALGRKAKVTIAKVYPIGCILSSFTQNGNPVGSGFTSVICLCETTDGETVFLVFDDSFYTKHIDSKDLPIFGTTVSLMDLVMDLSKVSDLPDPILLEEPLCVYGTITKMGSLADNIDEEIKDTRVLRDVKAY